MDLTIVAIGIGICSILGLPWVVAATVLSLAHVQSLFVESTCTAPGERPKFLGVRWVGDNLHNRLIFVLGKSRTKKRHFREELFKSSKIPKFVGVRSCISHNTPSIDVMLGVLH